MGFGLYINSRVEVEGWDLQLLFQKFAGARSPAGSRPGVTAILLLCFFLTLPQAAFCEEESNNEAKESVMYFPAGFPFADAECLEELEMILASPDFGGHREGWGIRLKEKNIEPPELPDLDLASWMAWLKKIRQTFGYIVRGLAILAVIFFAGFALYWYWKNRRKGVFRFRDGEGNYINPLLPVESPESLFRRAEDFFYRGNMREAWAACLAGCLGVYTRYRSLSFPADATEYGCLDLVRRALPSEAGGFEDLVQSWVLFAYGGRAPGEGAFEEAIAYGRSLLVERGSDEP